MFVILLKTKLIDTITNHFINIVVNTYILSEKSKQTMKMILMFAKLRWLILHVQLQYTRMSNQIWLNTKYFTVIQIKYIANDFLFFIHIKWASNLSKLENYILLCRPPSTYAEITMSLALNPSFIINGLENLSYCFLPFKVIDRVGVRATWIVFHMNLHFGHI